MFKMKKIKEFFNIIKVVRSARKCEDFLWGKYNEKWNFEEWKRMLAKRVHKIIKINFDNPHWNIELRKRLLQNACVSISLLNQIDILQQNEICEVESNLPEMDIIVKKCEKI